jgi:hypothetical protein
MLGLSWQEKIAKEISSLTDSKINTNTVETLYKIIIDKNISLTPLLEQDSIKLANNLNSLSLYLSNVSGIDKNTCKFFLLVFSDYYKKGIITKEIFEGKTTSVQSIFQNVSSEIKTFLILIIIIFIIMFVLQNVKFRKGV